MPTILPNDANLEFPSYTVVSASAGSGKTYTLTQRFIQLLLSDRVPHNSLRNILAITFTNQAATEMRSRLILFLKKLSLGDEEMLKEASELLSMKNERIREKASVVLAQILDQYSDLQIRTIDSFMSTVFRTSSFDFGYQPDLEIVFDNRRLISEAFEELTREMQSRPGLRKLLGDLVELIRETRSKASPFLWDPHNRILWEVTKLYGKIVSQEKKILSGGGLEPLDVIKKDLNRHVRRFRKAIDESGFEAYKNLLNEFAHVEAGNPEKVIDLKKKTAEKVLKKPRGSVREKQYTEQVRLLGRELDEFYRIIDLLTIWKSENRYQPYIDAIALVEETLDRIKRQRRQIFIEDINQALRGLLREERVVDAYLMLGEQIYHFLIDEFQDTAPIQWANIKPLIDNSLSQGGSLFVVGDTKQSIFSFRDADWRIMRRLLKGKEFPSARFFEYPLEENWRSYEEVVRYTERVFQENVRASEFAGDATLSGLDSVQQKVLPEHLGKGVAEVATVEWNEETRPEREEILRIIQDCKNRDYSERDIAIITPTNQRVLEVSGWLNRAGIRVLPFSSLDIRTRKVIGELIALLRFLDSPVDDASFATFLVGQVFRKSLDADNAGVSERELHQLVFASSHGKSGRTRAYKVLQARYPALWKEYLEDLFRLVGYLPLYDLVCEVFKKLRVFDLLDEEEASLVKLLDVVKEFGEGERNSLKDFLDFAGEEGETTTWQVEVPQDVDAVRAMTIHKAKGLEFNVTIVLLYDRDERAGRYFFKEDGDGIRLLWIGTKMRDRVPGLEAVYNAQRQNESVDRLNRLYVSLTRARREIFVVSVEGERFKVPSSLLAPADFQLQLRPKADVGTPDRKNELHPVHTRATIDYGGGSTAPFGFLETERGLVIHRVLAGIEFLTGDEGAVVDELLNDEEGGGDLPILDKAEIRKAIIGFLGACGSQLFEGKSGREVFREKEFVSSDGSLLRMDRVVVDPDNVTVIDFKTGKRSTGEYGEQIQGYLAVLKDVFPKRTLTGVLAYVDQCRIEPVG